LTKDTKERSHAYAKKYDLDCYEYVLHPRTTGVTYLIDYMRNSEYAIYTQRAIYTVM